MWYQRLSARSMPAASVPRVGTIQAAASAAKASAATTTVSSRAPARYALTVSVRSLAGAVRKAGLANAALTGGARGGAGPRELLRQGADHVGALARGDHAQLPRRQGCGAGV